MLRAVVIIPVFETADPVLLTKQVGLFPETHTLNYKIVLI